MCKYCDNPNYSSALLVFDESTGSDARIYGDLEFGGWVLEVLDAMGQNKTKLRIANCPWCGRDLDSDKLVFI